MAIQIKLTINVTGDFHIGTGTGRGRATDAVVVTDERDAPFIPGSTVKGLCKWQACRVIECYPGLGPKPDIVEDDDKRHELIGPVFEIFGGGSDKHHAERRVWFDHATASGTIVMTRSGRSARDRLSGRARDQHLFFYEDAGPAKFTTTLTCDDDLSPAAFLLLLLSLRRIEALGGQRRRGKGRCETTIRVFDPGSQAELQVLKGLVLPSADESQAKTFREFAAPLLETAKTAKPSPVEKNEKSGSPTTQTSTPIALSARTCWLVYAQAESPLTLGHDQAVDNTIYSEDFIAGGSLRGALAWRAIREGIDPESDLFQAVFGRERVQFGPLYPSAIDDWRRIPATSPLPMPMSFCTCKRYPGAKGELKVKAHGVADRMWHSGEKCDHCDSTSRCDSATQTADGYLQITGESRNAVINLGRPTMWVFQRTAIDEDTQRGADNQLYGLEAVQRGTLLAGYLWGEEELLKQTFGNLCDGKPIRIRVGKAKSRGQGVVQLWLKSVESAQHRDYPYLLPETVDASDDGFFVTLYSDLIAVDEYLRPVTQLTAERLWRLLGQTDSPPFELDKGFVSTRRIGGYLGVVGLPRTADLAIAAGSTWRFRWAGDQAARDEATKLLSAAQSAGIGLRRGEGFGRMIVNLPLHVARWENMQDVSHAVAIAPYTFQGKSQEFTRARSDRDRQRTLLHEGGEGRDVAYARLFAELAQQDNPLTALQDLFDDPLYREGKSKNLAQELKRIVGQELKLFKEEHGITVCIAKTLAGDERNVNKFRRLLKKHSGEVLDHV